MVVKKNRILSNTLQYASSNLFRQVLGVVSAFLRPRLLSAHSFGIWILLALIPQYASLLNFGARSAMRLRLAELDNKGSDAAVIRGSTRLGYLVPSILLALGFVIAGIYPLENSELRVCLILSAVIVMLNWWYDLQHVMLKAEMNFQLISRTNYLRATLLFCFTITLLPLWGLIGAVLAGLLANCCTCLFVYRYQKKRVYGSFQWRRYFELIREGFPLLGIDTMVMFARTSDRLVIASLLGTKAVGFYAIGGMIIGFLLNIPGAAREVTEPGLMQDFKKQSYRQFIEQYFCIPVFNTALLFPLIIGPAWLIMPLFLHVVLPDYHMSLAPAQVLFLGSYFLALYFPMRGLMFVHGWQHKSFATAAGILLLNVLGSILAIKLGFELIGVACVSATAFFSLFAVEGSLTVCRVCRKISMQPGKRFVATSLAFPLLLSIIYLLEYFFSPQNYGIYVATIIKILVFVCCWFTILGIFWWPQREGCQKKS